MSQARHAGFRRLRGFGWSVALPVAVIFGMMTWLVFGNVSAGLVVGAGVSIIGLILLSFGYSLGDIWGGYWMIPTVLVGGNIALITYAFGGRWVWVLLGTGVVVLMAALCAAIARTAASDGGVGQLCGHFARGLVPGQYPR